MFEGDAWSSESSVDLGSEPVVVVRFADIAQAVKEARDEQKRLLQQARDDLQQARDDLQQARDEQKMHTTKVLRAISDIMMLGVATLIVVIVLCTFVLYTKPPVSHTTCEPMVNHTKWEPVNHTTCEPPVNHTKWEPPVNHAKWEPPGNHAKWAPPPVTNTTFEEPEEYIEPSEPATDETHYFGPILLAVYGTFTAGVAVLAGTFDTAV